MACAAAGEKSVATRMDSKRVMALLPQMRDRSRVQPGPAWQQRTRVAPRLRRVVAARLRLEQDGDHLGLDGVAERRAPPRSGADAHAEQARADGREHRHES